METAYRRKYKAYIITAIILLLAAYLCRFPRYGAFSSKTRGWIRCGMQCGLLATWAISVYKRVLQRKARRYLLAVAFLFFFWLLDRTVKYTLFSDLPTAERYAWYLYYIPILLAPVFSVLAALCIGKPDTYKPSGKWKRLYLPALIGIVLILLNDLHQLAFRFPNRILGSDDAYSYGVLYYLVMLLIFLEAAGFFTILVRKCRLAGKGKRVLLPLIPMFALLIYFILYITALDFIEVFAGDMNAVICFMYITIFELCVYVGLFPVNTHYAELFHISGLDAQITDKVYRLLLAAEHNMTFSADAMRQAETAPVILDGNIRLSSAPIRGGHVLWTEDVSELAEVISELEDLDEDLAGRHMVLQEAYATRHRRRSLVEKNRLYNTMQNQTQDKIRMLSEMTEQLSNATDTEEIQALTAKIAVITAYLKRRNNLIFIAEESRTVAPSELTYGLRESLNNLRLCGADCEMRVSLTEPLRFEDVAKFYDAFEEVVELVMDGLRELYVCASSPGGVATLCLNIVCTTADLSLLCKRGFDVVQEDAQEWTVSYQIGKRGGEEG